jgi:hypothetical protein
VGSVGPKWIFANRDRRRDADRGRQNDRQWATKGDEPIANRFDIDGSVWRASAHIFWSLSRDHGVSSDVRGDPKEVSCARFWRESTPRCHTDIAQNYLTDALGPIERSQDARYAFMCGDRLDLLHAKSTHCNPPMRSWNISVSV